MQSLALLLTDPAAWAALITLIVMEVVLGIDNLVFVAILSNKLPEASRSRARKVGISLALVMRLALLSTLSLIVGMTTPVFSLPWQPPPGADGHPMIDLAFSWRDLILIAGGLFLVWKATTEIHEKTVPGETHGVMDTTAGKVATGFGAAIVQILLLDLVFSVDSILTAVGMTNELAIMMVAVVIAVGLMMAAADPLANFIQRNPTVVMLALGFLLMIGAVLIADGFGMHVPKGYIYVAMAFSGLVEGLNITARGAQKKRGPEK